MSAQEPNDIREKHSGLPVPSDARALIDRRLFMLDEARWEQFTAMLERPVEAKPRLRHMLGR